MVSSLGRNILLFFAIGYTLALTLGSLIKPVQFVEHPIRFMDKVLHLSAYFGLTILWIAYRYISNTSQQDAEYDRTMVVSTAIGAVIYGIIIEVLQGILTDYRTPDGWDILANTTGVLLAIIVIRLFINNFERLKSKF